MHKRSVNVLGYATGDCRKSLWAETLKTTE
jgi:hypothetical protein